MRRITLLMSVFLVAIGSMAQNCSNVSIGLTPGYFLSGSGGTGTVTFVYSFPAGQYCGSPAPTSSATWVGFAYKSAVCTPNAQDTQETCKTPFTILSANTGTERSTSVCENVATTAICAPLYQYGTLEALTVSTSAGGTVTSSPGGVSCPSTCVASFSFGTQITLNAVPSPGYYFSGWTGACSGTGSCSFPIDTAESVGATFAAEPELSINFSGSGIGTVNATPGPYCQGPTSCYQGYLPNTLVSLSAFPNAGSLFSGWSGACSGLNSSCFFYMSQPQTVTANFTLNFGHGLSSYAIADGYHVFYETGGNLVYQLYYNSAANTWIDQDLNGLANSGTLTAPNSSLTSFAVSNTQNIPFISSTNTVHQFSYNSGTGIWQDQNLTTLANSGTVVAQGSGLSSLVDNTGNHIYFTSSANQVHQLYYGSVWSDQNLMGFANSSTLVAQGSALSSYHDAAGEHLVFTSTANQIHQLYYSSGTGLEYDQNLMGFANSNTLVGQGSALSSYYDASGEHIAFTSNANQVHQLYYSSATSLWYDQNLMTFANSSTLVAQGSGLVGFSNAAGTHFYFTSSANQIHQLYYNSATGWSDQNLTAFANSSTVVAPGAGLSGFSDASGEHLFFTSNTNQVHELFYNSATGVESDINLNY